MDGRRFDRMTKLLASEGDRRSWLKRFAGVAVAGVAAASHVGEAGAGRCPLREVHPQEGRTLHQDE